MNACSRSRLQCGLVVISAVLFMLISARGTIDAKPQLPVSSVISVDAKKDEVTVRNATDGAPFGAGEALSIDVTGTVVVVKVVAQSPSMTICSMQQDGIKKAGIAPGMKVYRGILKRDPSFSKSDWVVLQYEELAETACACRDAECARNAMKEFKAISIACRDVSGNDRQIKDVGEAAMRFMNCIKELVTPEDLVHFAQELQTIGQ